MTCHNQSYTDKLSYHVTTDVIVKDIFVEHKIRINTPIARHVCMLSRMAGADARYTMCFKKRPSCNFLNNSVKN